MRALNSIRSLRRPHIASRRAFQQTRHFHPTKPTPLIAEVLDISSSAIYGIHSLTGLPWACSLPLTAVLVRMMISMPFQVFTKVQARKEQDIAPLLQSWKVFYQKNPETLHSTNSTTPEAAMKYLVVNVKNKQKQFKQEFNIYRYWKAANLIQLPVWLAFMDSVRNMCGDDRGFWPFLNSVLQNWRSPGEIYQTIGPGVEPSLATEGALWFPDLLAADPTGVLPLLLTASVITNIRIGWKTRPNREIAELPLNEFRNEVFKVALKHFLYGLAIYLGYAASHGMPAAFMIYWLGSTNLATLQTYFLDKYLLSGSPLKSWKKIHVGYSKPALKALAPK
ncbi:inner membrane protein Cox18 [Aspergillus sclerotialis]|uniref:Inner membrane protein Cox18 n=1 Tax=Aspergillus sclerotialis TaxID=2070753 RepID=A0A3A2ZN54_9EURO|nr:inner membrane protein Cox18 [Aspergillus sclerotialis]